MAVANTPPYQPSPPQIAPQTEDGRNLATWVQQQLEQIANALGRQSRSQLQPVSKPPVTPRDGLIAFADGTNWNPVSLFEGSKEAAVVYYNGAWVQLSNGPLQISDLGFMALGAQASQRPALSMVNEFNDNEGTFLIGNKARITAGVAQNTNVNDISLDIRAAGFLGGSFVQHTAIQMYQSAAGVGGVLPGAIAFFTSNTAQFQNTFRMDQFGNFIIPGGLFIGVLTQVAAPSDANAAAAGVGIGELYTTTADPHIVYVRTT